MLGWVMRHSPVLMAGFAVFGFLWPQGAGRVLPFLPEILFLLMCFSVLGLNQRELLLELFRRAVWRDALLHGAGMCVLAGGTAWLFGARGEWLLAIAAVAATSPLFASGAMAQTVGMAVLPVMARTIAATLLLPLVLLVLLFASQKAGARLDFGAYALKLLAYIAGPVLLAVVLRRVMPQPWLARLYPRFAQAAVILVFAFPFGLMAAFRHYWEAHGTSAALAVLGLALALCYGGCVLGYALYRRAGRDAALMAALLGGSRNVLLTLAVAGSFLGTEFLVLIGALQLPMFAIPVLARLWVKRRGGHA